jgi:FtsP/CotA-like multicopper oxidase with cupredoxin domain
VLGLGVSAAFWMKFSSADANAPARAPNADGFWELKAGPAEAALIAPPAPSVLALGFGGATPGPLLRLRQGTDLKVRLINGLKQPTTLTWPGMRMPNAVAGIGGLTQKATAPGANADIVFTPPDSGFNLYRPHAGAATPAQIAGGLYGPVIVDEPNPPQVDLDLIAILSDWRLGADGQINDDFADPALARGGGRIGALVSANGAPAPLTTSLAPGARVRLRFANAANARIMLIAIESAKSLIVAIDGQPCETFAPLRDLFPMGPGARFELMFDMPREARAVRFILKGDDAGALPGEADRPLIVFNPAGDPAPPRPAFAGLDANPRLPAEIDLGRAIRPEMAITGGGAAPFAVNGATRLDWPARPLFSVPKGAPVTVALVNKTAVPQAIRLHGHCMRLLHALDDGWEPYWRDVALIGPGKTVHAAFVADNPGKWPLDSAIPEHQAGGVMTWFEVR